ncbi:ParB N-terminal domain-containing protein [Streptomyces sp. NBC_01766]|uniref:ParB N-terminal domain-containing protein n=1 Tax=Streptomyces sp. NBC_01766 TaxID=2975936 RepID=UPI002DD7EBC8|nr:ParB N-terminal domain-containing protein [Streptomyces sp. NBC_01766]WSC24901.1 ParB N-terminal domain-containing protein [Streptomyces sp. NBC_01766]
MATATKPRPRAAVEKTTAPDDTELQAVLLDPAVISRDEQNARTTDTEPDNELISSVKAIGVQDAISVRPRPDGTYTAFKGWRRAQAAQIANANAEQEERPLQRVRAYVRTDLVGRDSWTRFLSLVENDVRQGMSERDTVQAVELALVGMSDVERTQATRALGLKGDATKAAKKAAKLSDRDLRSATAEGMDLEQLAEFYEVQDVSGALQQLSSAQAKDAAEGKGGRGHWDHAMARLRQDLSETEAHEAAVKALADAGVPLLRSRFGYGEKDLSRPLSQLTTGLLNPITEQMHTGCEGHSARLDDEHRPVWHCSDPEKYGHKLTAEAKKPKAPVDEAKRAERQKTISHNKAWKAAREVRKDFITGICQSKALPDEARKLALRTVMSAPHHYGQWITKSKTEDVARFLGIKDPQEEATPGSGLFDALVERTGKAREWHALFAHAAAASEYGIREDKAWASLYGDQAKWLIFLEALGYPLSEVEAEALEAHRPKDATSTAA